jgi:hypothetical protein
MFVKMSILKKFMKIAYKQQGLVLANSGERLLIAGDRWEMDILREMVPKELLAAIIELAGTVPDLGERFNSTKEGNQMEMANLTIRGRDCQTEYMVTDMILVAASGVHQRILQNYGTGKIQAVNEAFIMLIDQGEIDKKAGETEPGGPYLSEYEAMWENNVMRFKVRTRRDDENREILKKLEEAVDLTPWRMRTQSDDVPEDGDEEETEEA